MYMYISNNAIRFDDSIQVVDMIQFDDSIQVERPLFAPARTSRRYVALLGPLKGGAPFGLN